MNQAISRAGLLLAMVAGTNCGTPAVDVAAETDAIRARSKACVAAEAAKDIDGILAFYAKDAIVQPPGVPQLQGHEAIGGLYRQLVDSGLFDDFTGTTSHVTVSQSGDLAYEYGINRMVLAGPEGDLLNVGKYLLVWERIDGEWYIGAISVTWDAPEPSPVEEE